MYKINNYVKSWQYGYLQIRAPFSGVISARNVNPGAYVEPSGKGSEMPLFTLQEQKKLLPGRMAEVHLPLPANDSTFVVPKTAVVNSTESAFVIRVVNNKAEWVNVKTGSEANGIIEVYGNLNAGDLILKTATDELRNGSALQHVKTVAL